MLTDESWFHMPDWRVRITSEAEQLCIHTHTETQAWKYIRFHGTLDLHFLMGIGTVAWGPSSRKLVFAFDKREKEEAWIFLLLRRVWIRIYVCSRTASHTHIHTEIPHVQPRSWYSRSTWFFCFQCAGGGWRFRVCDGWDGLWMFWQLLHLRRDKWPGVIKCRGAPSSHRKSVNLFKMVSLAMAYAPADY